MKYALLIYSAPDTNERPYAEAREAWVDYARAVKEAGILLGAEQLAETDTATSVRVRGGGVGAGRHAAQPGRLAHDDRMAEGGRPAPGEPGDRGRPAAVPGHRRCLRQRCSPRDSGRR